MKHPAFSRGLETILLLGLIVCCEIGLAPPVREVLTLVTRLFYCAATVTTSTGSNCSARFIISGYLRLSRPIETDI